MKRFFNGCRRYRESICLLASGVLPEQEKAAVECHLEACDSCRKYHEEMAMVTGLLVDWERRLSRLYPEERLQIRGARAVRAAAKPRTGRPDSPGFARPAWWRKLLWPCPQAWAGLGAVWLVILAVNIISAEKSDVVAKKSPALSPTMIMSLKEQERVLAELITAPERPVAEKPKLFTPKPRSAGAGKTAGV